MTAQPGALDGTPAPQWGYSTGFFQRRQPAFWLFLVTLAITGIDAVTQQLDMISAVPGAWFTTVLLLLPYAIPVIAIVYLLDLYEREPVSILVAALVWGGIAATTLSMYVNTPMAELIFKLSGDAGFTDAWSAALTAPFVEEGFKALGVILLVSIARAEMDDVLDGFIWGAMVGIGFLLVEDVFYFVRAFAESGSYDGLFAMFMIRILGAGPYSHFLYTGLTGMGIAYYVTRTDRTWGRRVTIGLLYAAAGVGAHFFWNSPVLGEILGDGGLTGWAMFVTAKGLPMLIGLVLVVRLARRRERRWFRAFSQSFFDDGAITEAELDELGGLRARRRARKAAGRAKGPMGERIRGQIQRQQIGLAALMSRYGSEQHPAVDGQRQVVMSLKTQFAMLGATAPAVAAWGPQAMGPRATATPVQPASAVASGWAQPAVAQPRPAGSVAAPAPAPAPPPAWTPTHRAPDGGLPAWAAPDPAQPPVVTLAGRLDLVVVERAGDWARVRAVNGWTGWVDARRLLPQG